MFIILDNLIIKTYITQSKSIVYVYNMCLCNKNAQITLKKFDLKNYTYIYF